nr:PREDICTED: uncharacterized protein LOC105670743 [Linepithema humile]
MDRLLNRVRSSHEINPERMKVYEKRRAKTVIESELSPHILKNYSNSFQTIKKIVKSPKKETFFDNEVYKIIRAMLLALSILVLCYHGSKEYNILGNGQIVSGFTSREIIMTFSLGYSVTHSVISAIAASMLIYSIISKRPQFSLPLMGLFMAEMMCDSCDAIVTMWYLFRHLGLQTALFYTTGLFLLICKFLYFFTSHASER